MNSAAIQDLLKRLRRVEDRAVHHSTGIVASASPLTVAVGGSAVATTMRVIDGLRLSSGDVVSVLTWGNDPGLVIGRVTTNGGTVRGVVNADGTVNRGSGFTATRHATGFYSAYFTAAFATAPVVQVSSHAGEPNGIYLFSVSTTEVQVVIEQSPGNRLDAIWHFIAMAV